jgi:hypothetical protein
VAAVSERIGVARKLKKGREDAVLLSGNSMSRLCAGAKSMPGLAAQNTSKWKAVCISKMIGLSERDCEIDGRLLDLDPSWRRQTSACSYQLGHWKKG